MAITVKDIQNSLRIPDGVDDDLIQRYIDTAEAYVKNAVDSKVDLKIYRQLDEFNTAVALFAEFLYMSRGQAGKQAEQRPFEINAMIGQLEGMDLPENTDENSQNTSDNS